MQAVYLDICWLTVAHTMCMYCIQIECLVLFTVMCCVFSEDMAAYPWITQPSAVIKRRVASFCNGKGCFSVAPVVWFEKSGKFDFWFWVVEGSHHPPSKCYKCYCEPCIGHLWVASNREEIKFQALTQVVEHVFVAFRPDETNVSPFKDRCITGVIDVMWHWTRIYMCVCLSALDIFSYAT